MRIDFISQTIERALAAAGLSGGGARGETAATTVIHAALANAGLLTPCSSLVVDPLIAERSRPPGELSGPRRPSAAGEFVSLSHEGETGRRSYKLYVPSGPRFPSMPLIVMLHGCKQNPDDFAAGTRMNELAEKEGFLVAYPAQTARGNGSNCWNWFDGAQQVRDGTEPSQIAGIVQDLIRSHGVDKSRVYVAGLSAGAAMAVILGATWPDVFAGVAAHSGLPLGAAHDVASAFAAMQGRSRPVSVVRTPQGVPTIVFQGDRDSTVSAVNGTKVVEQALSAYANGAQPLHSASPLSRNQGGRSCSTTVYADATDQPRIEEWVVHGGSHAWFGGSPKGSYTEPSGPDASAEIVRFFLQQRLHQ